MNTKPHNLDLDLDLDIDAALNTFRSLQHHCCEELGNTDPDKAFCRDEWNHENGKGGGVTRTLQGGKVIEKGGVNFSLIAGDALPAAASSRRVTIAGKPFLASGVSAVIHPNNPYVPTAHLNVRLFVADHQTAKPIWWFGGGFDLTPYYGFEQDCIAWHVAAKHTCEKFKHGLYDQFKTQCDDYFFLPHRKEARGIGGIFFDDFNELGYLQSLQFIKTVGETFVRVYKGIIERRKNHPFTPHHKEFQKVRRGRYVEFNLIYDRGTLFGLQSLGRTESILMSLPADVTWKYNWQPTAQSEEARLTEYFLKPQDWANKTPT